MKSTFAVALVNLEKLKKETIAFSEAEKALLVAMSNAEDRASQFVAKTSRASNIESIYSGIEAILKALLNAVGEKVESIDPKDGSGWHKQLLYQSSIATNDRPAILSGDLLSDLDELRAFRHLERNIYGIELKADRVAKLVPLALSVADRFATNANAFIDRMSAKPKGA
jgi:hypothetical protein